MHYQEESYYDIVAEITPIVYKHHEEVDLYQEHMKMDPDYEVYGNLADAGILKTFTLRNTDDQLIGYNFFCLQTNPHYKGTLWASNDIVYIDPAYRNTEHTMGFFLWCESQLRDSGAEVISYTMKVNKSFHSLMDHLGI